VLLTSSHPQKREDCRDGFVRRKKRRTREYGISRHRRCLRSGSAGDVLPGGASAIRIFPSFISSIATFFSNGDKDSIVSRVVTRTGGYFVSNMNSNMSEVSYCDLIKILNTGFKSFEIPTVKSPGNHRVHISVWRIPYLAWTALTKEGGGKAIPRDISN